MMYTCQACGFKGLTEPAYDKLGNRVAVSSSDMMITRCSARMVHI
ncbi:hypothetical protein ABE060_15195 [Bacillus rugosus]|nr:hypothetical protein [Bacillus rugosus]